MTGKKKKKQKSKSTARSGSKSDKPKAHAASEAIKQISIDESRGLVFQSEDEVYKHFTPQIAALEKEYHTLRNESDTELDELEDIETHLTELLQQPDEVWLSDSVIEYIPLGTFIGYYETEDEEKNFYDMDQREIDEYLLTIFD